MTFKDLAIGDTFKFDPGVWTFGHTCTKVTARKYKWQDANGWNQTKVGTIKVGVRRV